MTHDDHDEAHPEEITLLDYAVGDLGPDGSDAIRRHVGSCASCRERLVELSAELDELDRLPLVAIPHDLLRGMSRTPGAVRRRSAARRITPFLILAAVAVAVVALFQLGGMRVVEPSSTSGPIVLQTAAADPQRVVGDLLGTLPHAIVVDGDDPRHLVVLVGDADAAAARARLSVATGSSGRSYVIDVATTGAPPTRSD